MNETVSPRSLSIYIHLPWCLRKCPYCDFNSHEFTQPFPEERYVKALQADLAAQKTQLSEERVVTSIFFGGGTPSLFSAQAISAVLDSCYKNFHISYSVEITLEANPGAADQQRFEDYFQTGINRLSLGVQSFSDSHLQALGRVHSAEDARAAIQYALDAGFESLNIDLMFGLPGQTLEQSLSDLQCAIAFEPTHLSYYQLTLEPNTLFAKHPPCLPEHDALSEIQDQAIELLCRHGLQRYEVSAYSRPEAQCRHNINYWLYGDYLGIGAGAHGKLTNFANRRTIRRHNRRMPESYMTALEGALPYHQSDQPIPANERLFEFMLNALRLTDGFDLDNLRTNALLEWSIEHPGVVDAIQKGLISQVDNIICATDLGYRHLNDTVACFLPRK